VADYEGKPSVPEVQAGDVLVSVDGGRAKGATMGQVWSLLEGSPGTIRTLVLERDGKQFTVKAPVRRFLAAETKKVRSKSHAR
jgi:C-terminal processing protease CtpA/Prc